MDMQKLRELAPWLEKKFPIPAHCFGHYEGEKIPPPKTLTRAKYLKGYISPKHRTKV